MNRVRIFACAGTGLALAALAWCLPQSLSAEGMVVLVGRSVGLALLGIAMVAAGLVFRAAMKTPKTLPVPTPRPGTSEFRRGFAAYDKAKPAHRPSQGEVVVALRRAVADHGRVPQPPSQTAVLPPPELERLQDMLHSRAAQLRTRNAEQAKRQFLRSGVDVHGLTRT